jgi:hypothetical protein
MELSFCSSWQPVIFGPHIDGKSVYLGWFSKRTTVNLHLVRGFSSLPRLIVADLPLTLLVSRVWIPLSHPTMDSEGGWVPTMIPGPTGKLHVCIVCGKPDQVILIPFFFLCLCLYFFCRGKRLKLWLFPGLWFRMCQGFTRFTRFTIPCIPPCCLRAPSWTMRLKS